MRVEIVKMKDEITSLNKKNEEITKKCEENHNKNQILNNQSDGRYRSDDQVYKTNRPEDFNNKQEKSGDDAPYTVVKTKKKKKIPPMNITPNDPNKKFITNTPPMAYADVVFRNLPKPPKEVLTKQQIEAVPELREAMEKDLKDDRIPQKFTDDELETIRNKIYKSSHIVGIRPISIQQIHDEAEKLRKSGLMKKTDDRKKCIATATKNVIMRFFRDHLKMDDETRNNLEITKIFPSQNKDTNIMYVQCSSTEEIAKITSLAKNIRPSNLKESNASIAIHIPKILYARYLSIEKLMFQLRMSSKG